MAGGLATGTATPAQAASATPPDWKNVLDYGATPGAADSTAAFQQAINSLPTGGGVVYVPAGDYSITSGPLLPVSGLTLLGDGRLNTSINATGAPLIDATNNSSANSLDTVEIGHLALSATNAHLITGANVARWYIHDCTLSANTDAFSIWSASSTLKMVECRFERNSEYVHGASRSAPGWDLKSTNSSPLISQNVWQDEVCFNVDSDPTHVFYSISGAGSGGHRNNAWRNILFEHPYGGMIRTESGTGVLIDHCWSMDTPPPSSPGGGLIKGTMFQIAQSSGGAAPTGTTIQHSGRLYGSLNGGVFDIQLDAGCVQTLIQGCGSLGSAFAVDLGGSANVCLVGLPIGSALSVTNASATTYRLGSA